MGAARPATHSYVHPQTDYSSRTVANKIRILQTRPRSGIGPPQAAWCGAVEHPSGAVEHPSGGPSAPGRRCWRLGRKRPSPF